jgi:hypothetical protein
VVLLLVLQLELGLDRGVRAWGRAWRTLLLADDEDTKLDERIRTPRDGKGGLYLDFE